MVVRMARAKRTQRRPKTLYLDEGLTTAGEKFALEYCQMSLSSLIEELLRKKLRRAGVAVKFDGGEA